MASKAVRPRFTVDRFNTIRSEYILVGETQLSSVTNLSSDDRWVDDELNKLVEQLVQEPDARVQLSPSQSRHAGLQLPLHVGLGDDDVLQAEGEGVLLQDVDQGEELVQVGVLQGRWETTLVF